MTLVAALYRVGAVDMASLLLMGTAPLLLMGTAALYRVGAVDMASLLLQHCDSCCSTVQGWCGGYGVGMPVDVRGCLFLAP